MRAFGDALESIPAALAENAGMSPVAAVAAARAKQAAEGNPCIGIDCMDTGTDGEQGQGGVWGVRGRPDHRSCRRDPDLDGHPKPFFYFILFICRARSTEIL